MPKTGPDLEILGLRAKHAGVPEDVLNATIEELALIYRRHELPLTADDSTLIIELASKRAEEIGRSGESEAPLFEFETVESKLVIQESLERITPWALLVRQLCFGSNEPPFPTRDAANDWLAARLEEHAEPDPADEEKGAELKKRIRALTVAHNSLNLRGMILLHELTGARFPHPHTGELVALTSRHAIAPLAFLCRSYAEKLGLSDEEMIDFVLTGSTAAFQPVTVDKDEEGIPSVVVRFRAPVSYKALRRVHRHLEKKWPKSLLRFRRVTGDDVRLIQLVVRQGYPPSRWAGTFWEEIRQIWERIETRDVLDVPSSLALAKRYHGLRKRLGVGAFGTIVALEEKEKSTERD